MSADTVETRQTAVSTISEIWQPSDFAIILGIYKNDHSDLVKREGAWTLVAHATGENCRLLFNLFRADTTSRHRVWACRLAAQFGTQDIMNQLKALAIDSDGHVRKAAHLAIKQLTRPQVN
jgi:hypothetical protein